jgi:ABC-type glutathione transport system ATPase component
MTAAIGAIGLPATGLGPMCWAKRCRGCQESGSGKSTLARCIARLIEPTSGDIEANGRSVAHLRGRQLSPFRRDVQVIFQDPYRSLNPRQTVGSSIVEGPINFGVPRAQAWCRAEELMGLVRLRPEVLSRFPSEFSGRAAPAHLNRKGAGLRTQASHCR